MEAVIRKEIYAKIVEIFNLRRREYKFTPFKTKVQYSGTVYDEEEVNAMVEAILDGWFIMGKNCRMFEVRLSNFLKSKEAVLVNAGSSANLLSISALMSPQWNEDYRLERGNEVITPALTFPTTFNPIIQNNLTPVIMDVELGTYNIDAKQLKEAVTEKTRAIMIPHTLGNPCEMDVIMDFAKDYGLYVIEDACDSLGAKYDGKFTGTFGIMGTFSFYPAHHMTLGGEGGAIITDNDTLPKIIRSLRDWGRACACPVCSVSLNPNYNCPLRFQAKEDMPKDYDQRYIYTNVGYNLKPVEVQGAMGLVQLKKLPSFIEARKKNFKILYEEFENYENYFILPKSLPKSEPSWYSFPLTVREKAPFKRKDVIDWFNKHNIEIKNIFAGNITRQPAYKNVKYRVAQPLTNSDIAMSNSFFIGLYPGIDDEKMNFMLSAIRDFMIKFA